MPNSRAARQRALRAVHVLARRRPVCSRVPRTRGPRQRRFPARRRSLGHGSRAHLHWREHASARHYYLGIPTRRSRSPRRSTSRSSIGSRGRTRSTRPPSPWPGLSGPTVRMIDSLSGQAAQAWLKSLGVLVSATPAVFAGTGESTPRRACWPSPGSSVHEEAERLEHWMSPVVEERMLQAIGDAKTCPHGHPIFEGERELGVPLADVEEGQACACSASRTRPRTCSII